ncbi:TRAP transporter substrate-binding protein [Kordiimonas sp. SCSIO 12610]|uniref:TRAP transporter substrate-binding protein n=1 Tax=Kordiimonas sp. SCSIO 12610 TaxID=2829597 RepID=UPI00210D733D|nr:TRAP transporter substrate-binding protein [Kordiimonas sp. SCSIO 12610]UTW55556.1 TRAP transporter substrate-binding protein [Kordiimonas sp. SCSIO 12610]
MVNSPALNDDDQMRFLYPFKVYLAAFGLFAAVIIIFLVLANSFDRAPKQLDLSIPWAESEFHTQNAIRFAREVGRITEGRVQITVHPGAILGIKGPDSLRAVSTGIVPMAEMAGFQQVGSEPILGFESLPFLIDTQEELRALYTILRPVVEEAYARHGLKVLYIVPWPNQNLFSDARPETLRDLRGLKIRTLDANTTELMDRLGLVSIQMPYADVVPSLAAGSLDGVLTSTSTASAQKYWEFITTVLRTNHHWISNMMIIKKSVWDEISQNDRDAINALTQELEPEFWAISARDDKEKLKLLAENGVEVLEPNPELQKSIRSVSHQMWREFIERVPESEDILDAYLKMTNRPPLKKEGQE